MNRLFAIVTLVGVAIALTAAGVAWISTTYHSMMWRPEILRIYDAEIYRNETDDKWWLYIGAVNKGGTVAEIYKIEIHGIEEVVLNPPKTVEPGQQKDVHIGLSREYSRGTTYLIKLYLKSGTLYLVIEKVTKT